MSNSQSSSPRTWLITGASSGIGCALTRAVAERGDNVTALAREVGVLAPLVQEFGGRVRAAAADVTDQAALERIAGETVAAFGRIDVVVNNAGVGVSGGVEEASEEQARAIFDTNVHGVLNVLRATLPILRRQRSGHVLQTSSFLGQTSGAGFGLLSATKYAVEGLSEALAVELAPLGIDVTIVEPGLTTTAFVANIAGRGPDRRLRPDGPRGPQGDRRTPRLRVQRARTGSPPRSSPRRRGGSAPAAGHGLHSPFRRCGPRSTRGCEEIDAVAPLSESVDAPAPPVRAA